MKIVHSTCRRLPVNPDSSIILQLRNDIICLGMQLLLTKTLG